VTLLSQKFNDKDLEEAAGVNSDEVKDGGQWPDDKVVEDSDNSSHETSQVSLLENKVRGRHQSLNASLRISKIEKVLSTRSDLTRQQRRKLQSRKNTANFRER